METNLLKGYKTSHVPLAAYLRINGAQLIRVTCEGRRGVFEFDICHREHIIEFNNGQARVEPGEFAEKMSQLTQTAKRVMTEQGDR